MEFEEKHLAIKMFGTCKWLCTSSLPHRQPHGLQRFDYITDTPPCSTTSISNFKCPTMRITLNNIYKNLVLNSWPKRFQTLCLIKYQTYQSYFCYCKNIAKKPHTLKSSILSSIGLLTTNFSYKVKKVPVSCFELLSENCIYSCITGQAVYLI